MKPNDQIVKAIAETIAPLSPQDRETIYQLLDYHEVEPGAAAERIGDLLSVPPSDIYDLL
jgi:hypothetical protein